jgi:hypothetical protein
MVLASDDAEKALPQTASESAAPAKSAAMLFPKTDFIAVSPLLRSDRLSAREARRACLRRSRRGRWTPRAMIRALTGMASLLSGGLAGASAPAAIR